MGRLYVWDEEEVMGGERKGREKNAVTKSIRSISIYSDLSRSHHSTTRNALPLSFPVGPCVHASMRLDMPRRGQSTYVYVL